jgi:hypothetical protein
VEAQGLLWFTDGSGTEQGIEDGIYGPRMRLFFSLGKRICKNKALKVDIALTGGCAGETWKGVPLPWTSKDR